MASFQPHPSSYRDPSGFLFHHNGTLYRQVAKSFAVAFDQFHNGGLSQQLIEKGFLTPYALIEANLTGDKDWHCTLKPEVLPFVSYPYEWCFDMLKDAAFTTLQIATEAMSYGMMLKDASAYNMQWNQGHMQLIDTLSFEPYDEQKPWIAYRQFCEQFLAPLSLMHYLQTPLQSLQLSYPEGIPLPLVKKLLPQKSKLNLHVYLHLHLQTKVATNAAGSNSNPVLFSKRKMQDLLKSLRQAIDGFSFTAHSSVWSAYYTEAAEREDYLTLKKEIVHNWFVKLDVKNALDTGANEGEFSMLLAKKGVQTIAADTDHYSINKLYKKTKESGVKNLLPLIIDFSNPSPAIGVNNEERLSFLKRTKVDLVLALAIIHHLCIGKNIDFEKLAKMFAVLGKWLLIEFVPKEDEKVRLMLQQKPDVYAWYTKDAFLRVFGIYFKLLDEMEIGSSGRTLYLMERC